MPSLHLRPAVPEDAGELLSIYRPYVEHTAVTFEYAVPTPAQFTQRVRDTLASLRFHQRLGYTPAGQFHQCGYKFGRWYHMVWMEKFLGAHSLPPAPFLPFPQLGERTAGLLAPWATAAVW